MKTKATQRKVVRQQLDFWPEQQTRSMVALARLATTQQLQRGGARSVSAGAATLEPGRRLGNPALNPDSFMTTVREKSHV